MALISMSVESSQMLSSGSILLNGPSKEGPVKRIFVLSPTGCEDTSGYVTNAKVAVVFTTALQFSALSACLGGDLDVHLYVTEAGTTDLVEEMELTGS
jgi:hypothetical protein